MESSEIDATRGALRRDAGPGVNGTARLRFTRLYGAVVC